jgi:glyoxylase-like metal-dependent hydrolase (beta-lactamase superfamily II)
VVVRELAPGLWRWTALHPDWTPEQAEDGQGWEREVGCVYLEAPDAIVLIDPLVPTEMEARETFLRNLDEDLKRKQKRVAILLTLHDHQRSTAELSERYRASVWATAAAADRVEAEVANQFEPGDELPGGLVALDAQRPGEVMYWVPRYSALVTGDAVLGAADGVRLCPPSWVHDRPYETFRLSLRALLDLPVRRVLVSHGEPVLENGRAALERALAD